MEPVSERHFGGAHQRRALVTIGVIGLVGGVLATGTAIWLNSLEGPMLALLASYVLALVIPATAVYLLATFHTDRRLGVHEIRQGRERADIEDRLGRIEEAMPQRNGGPEDPPAGTVLKDPEPEIGDGSRALESPPGGDLVPGEADEASSDDMDPWMGAFGGCLQGREVVDRQPLPWTTPDDEEDPRKEEAL